MSDKTKGKVKWFSPENGFGFIETDDIKDIFVYYSSISSEGFKELKKGQEVEFTLIEGGRGPEAENVIIIK